VDALLTIGEVAERAGIAHSALRFYEAEGLVHSERTSGNQRRYHRSELRRIAFIRVAQRVGLTLDEIREALATLPSSRAPTEKEWAELSRSWRPRLDEQGLRDQLDSCIGCGCLSFKVCRLYNPGDVAGTHGPGPRYLLGDPREGAVEDQGDG
jgi:MerR family transcriptional regulator, redox-sensitive transcriptional activator SoxR